MSRTTNVFMAIVVAVLFGGCENTSSNRGSGSPSPSPPPGQDLKARTGCPDPDDKKVFYTSQDTAFCATAKIACGSKQKSFNDTCGCGCIDE